MVGWFQVKGLSPIELAKKVGYSLAGNIGEEAFIELELAYATKLIPKFTDDQIVRINQNLLLYWHYGYYKSTILGVFSQTIPDHLKVVDITSMTLEKIFGSIDEKRKYIILPAFTNDVNFVIISELTSLLGQRDAMRRFANTMNVVLEGEKVARQILKLAHAEIDEENIRSSEAVGVSYDSERGELSYTPNVCVFAATRPFENRYFTFLNKSGHLSRYHTIQIRITAEDASEHLHKDYKLDQNALAKLKETNQQLSKINVSKILRPSEQLMKPIYDDIEELIKDEIVERPHLELPDVITPRLKDDIIRELIAHAFMRTAHQTDFLDIQELRYTQEDVEFIRDRLAHFYSFALNPIIAEEFTLVSKKKSKIMLCSDAIVEVLSEGSEKARSEIVEYVKEKTNACVATIDNTLKTMVRAERIWQPKHGYYQIRKSKK